MNTPASLPTTHLLQTPLDLSLTAQATSLQPEKFQATLIANISAALLRQPAPPCLLRAPTGAGKTFMIGQVLQRVGSSAMCCGSGLCPTSPWWRKRWMLCCSKLPICVRYRWPKGATRRWQRARC